MPIALGKPGQQPIHRLIEARLAFLDQDHRRRGQVRLVTEPMRQIVSRRIGSLPPWCRSSDTHLAAPAGYPSSRPEQPMARR